MVPSRPDPDHGPHWSLPVRWLRVLKLLLTVVLLAIAVWKALAGLPIG